MEITMTSTKQTLQELLNSTEAADLIAVESMIWHYNALMEDNQKLYLKEDKGSHNYHDIHNNIVVMEALKQVLRFYGTFVE
jgi:hypothetical protein